VTETESGPAEPSNPLAAVIAHLRELASAVQRLADIGAERARLGLRRALALAVFWVWISVVLAAATVLGVAHAIAGLTALLTQSLGGRIWLGELLTGGIVLGSVLLYGLTLHARISRANLARLRRKYEPPKEPS
jgi:hypothetical protein